MGLLDHLWDDTVAGPRPDTGLGKLRKCSSFSPSTTSAAAAPGGVPVTRSITILRSSAGPRSGSADSVSEPSSPASAPDSPLTPTTPRGDWKRLRKKPAPEGVETAEPRNPTVYDWVIISALDK